jgi:hypothetical protein
MGTEADTKKTKYMLMFHGENRRNFHEIRVANKNFKIIKIKLYINIILPVLLFECENWCLALREVLRLRIFEKWDIGKVFGPKRARQEGSGVHCLIKSFMNCISHQILLQ